jgi:hypothetical protein
VTDAKAAAAGSSNLPYVENGLDSFQSPRRNRRIGLAGVFQRQKHGSFESLDEIGFEFTNGFESSRWGQSFRAEKCRNRDSQHSLMNVTASCAVLSGIICSSPRLEISEIGYRRNLPSAQDGRRDSLHGDGLQ